MKLDADSAPAELASSPSSGQPTLAENGTALSQMADGHHDILTRRADRIISFGAATWPHMLFRAMLAEQLYRATTILAGHPYHRG